MSLLKELSADHPYYCSGSNFYSNEPARRYESMTEFLDDFESADIDMNLCFRWDIREHLDDDEVGLGTYYAEVFLMLQRKGIFMPCHISSISEEEAPRFKAYAAEHLSVLQDIWAPLWKGDQP